MKNAIKNRLKKAFAAVAAVFALTTPVGLTSLAEGAVAVSPQRAGISAAVNAVPQACPVVRAKSRHSLYIADLQRKFGRLPGHVPLVILDQDEIGRCQGWLMAGTALSQKLVAFERAVGVFVKEVSGITLPSEVVESRAEALTDGRISAEAFLDVGKNPVLTVLVPGNPDQSVYTALQDFAESDNARAGYDFFNDALRSQRVVSAGIFRMWADVHEIMHGLDPVYTPALRAAKGAERLLARHRAEMLADVASVLWLAADGQTQGPQLARFLADLRTVNTIPAKKIEEGSAQMSAVYYTAPGLRCAANYISEKGDAIRGMTVEQILSTARDLVEANALDHPAMKALSGHLWQGTPSGGPRHEIVDSYEDEVQLSRNRLRVQVEDYHNRHPTFEEQQESSMGLYATLLAEARAQDRDAEAFAARIASTRDELRDRFVYGLSTIDENEIENLLEETGRAAIDFGLELRERLPSGAKPRPKPSRPPRPR